MKLRSDHLAYLKERGANPERLMDRYQTIGDDLCIFYCDANGQHYTDTRGDKYCVRRPFPTGKPKFVAPVSSGSRPYLSPLMPEGTSVTDAPACGRPKKSTDIGCSAGTPSGREKLIFVESVTYRRWKARAPDFASLIATGDLSVLWH